MGYCST